MDELTFYGDEIKATEMEGGAVMLGGYLLRYGSPSETDLAHDFFTKNTDYGDAVESATWFNHCLPVKLKRHNVEVEYTEPLPKAKLKRDDVGIFAAVVIEARNEYEKTIAELGMAGKLSWSSGTASHLVNRKSVEGGAWEITRWYLGLDASLTPTPAEFRNTNKILPIKSLLPDSALPDGKRVSNKEENTGDREEVKMEISQQEEIRKLVADGIAKELKARDDESAAKAARETELKNAADAAYKQAVEDIKANKAPAFNRNTDLGFSEEKDAVPAFKHWVQTGQTNGGLIVPDASYGKIVEAKAAWNVTTGGSGGYLVPDPLYNQIIAKHENQSWVRQLPVQSFQTPADHLLIPREDTKHTNFVQTAEGVSYDENEGTVSQKDLILYKYTKLTKVSEEFLMYNGTNWESWFAGAMSRSVAQTENTIYTTGTGSGEPEGILTGATVANTTATTDVILPAELTGLMGYLGDGYNVAGQTGLLMANITKWYLAGQTGNPFLYQGTPAGQAMGEFFHGVKNVVNDVLEPYTTASAKCIVFGNFNFYGVVEKPGMVIQRNPYLYMATGQVGLFASIFRGGGVLQSEAFYYLTNKSS